MKKIITIALLFACPFTYGQSIKLFSIDKNKWLEPDDTVTVTVLNSDMIYASLDITNVSENSVELMIHREIIEILPNAENAFCFETCFNSDVNETTKPYSLSAGDTLFYDDGYFYTTYKTNGAKGISIIKYTFYDNNNLDDATSVIFKFDSENAVGIEQVQDTEYEVRVYPNPVRNKLQITTYELQEEVLIQIFNITGQRLLSLVSSHSQEITINVETLGSGMYFLKVGNKVVKFIKK